MTSIAKLEKSSAKSRSCILVLGMHRSGTSALSGVFSLLGADLPVTLMTDSPSNPKGHFESNKVYKFQQSLLESAGTTWDDWTEFDSRWHESEKSDEFKLRAAEILFEEFGDSNFFILKDPRICRIAPFWLNALESIGVDPHIVLIHRNPLEVAESLRSRNDFSVPFGILIWLRHVLDAEKSTRGMPRYFTNFDRLINDWQAVVQGIQDNLGIKFPHASDEVVLKIEDFLEGSLKHFNEPDGNITLNSSIPRWVSAIYVVLEKWAYQGEDIADHAILDNVRQALTDASAPFKSLVKDGQSIRKELSKGSLALTEAKERLSCNEMMLREEVEARSMLQRAVELEREHLDRARLKISEQEGEIKQIRKLDAAASEIRKAINDLTDALTKQSMVLEDSFQKLEVKFTADQSRAEQFEMLLAEKEKVYSLNLQIIETEYSQKLRRLARNNEVISADLIDRERDINVQAKQIDDRFRELATLTRMLIDKENVEVELKKKIRELDDKYCQIVASTSWRITGPLRRLVLAMRRSR